MPHFEMKRYVDNILVEPGAVVVGPWTSERFFGQRISVGGRCLSVTPEKWLAIIVAGSTELWTGSEHPTERAARSEAESHARSKTDQALRQLFS